MEMNASPEAGLSPRITQTELLSRLGSRDDSDGLDYISDSFEYREISVWQRCVKAEILC